MCTYYMWICVNRSNISSSPYRQLVSGPFRSSWTEYRTDCHEQPCTWLIRGEGVLITCKKLCTWTFVRDTNQYVPIVSLLPIALKNRTPYLKYRWEVPINHWISCTNRTASPDKALPNGWGIEDDAAILPSIGAYDQYERWTIWSILAVEITLPHMLYSPFLTYGRSFSDMNWSRRSNLTDTPLPLSPPFRALRVT